MKICIVGWYGTETLGDRAILDGIIEVLGAIDSDLTIYLGSLYPFYTKRTIAEDKIIYNNAAPGVKIIIFPVKDQEAYKKCIDCSDAILVGGGPLMDLEELFLIRQGYRYASKRGIRRIVFGCGIGPLNNPVYIEVVQQILEMADAIFVRDSFSADLKDIFQKYNMKSLGDPAILSVLRYKKRKEVFRGTYAAINFRNYDLPEYGYLKGANKMSYQKTIEYLAQRYEYVYLIPMHTFCIGGDDRYIMTKVVQGKNYKNVEVIQRPLNLYDMYKFFAEAKALVGMRYHSILIQTILNGNNYIYNYTGNNYGKIRGFICEINGEDFYSDRIWNMNEQFDENRLSVLLKNEKFYYVEKDIKGRYVEELKKVLFIE